MNVDDFTRVRTADWDELRRLVDTAGRHAHRLGPDGVLRLGELYRAAAADLALARRAYAGAPFVAGLERLVQRSRSLVYGRAVSFVGAGNWFRHGYWQMVRSRPHFLALAFLALMGPMVLCGYWAWSDPDAARGLVPGQFEQVTEPRESWQGEELSTDEQAAFSSMVLTNNIRVTAMAFAAGVFLGVGTLLMLAYNGVVIGVVAGLAIQAGNGRIFFEFVPAHGVLELSCIIVGGAAGMRIGWAVVDPGYSSRGDALRREAPVAVQILMGTSLCLVIAGLLEGFVSPRSLDIVTVCIIGFSVGGAYWAAVFGLGRGSRRSRQSPRPEVPIVTGVRVT